MTEFLTEDNETGAYQKKVLTRFCQCSTMFILFTLNTWIEQVIIGEFLLIFSDFQKKKYGTEPIFKVIFSLYNTR